MTDRILFANFAISTLASGITSGATTLNVAVGTGVKFSAPAAGQSVMATLFDTAGNKEVIKVTARSTDQLTIVRAQEGTTARAWNSGDGIIQVPTAGILDLMAQKRDLDYLTAAGTGNAITLTPDPALGAYEATKKIRFRVTAANTAAVTVNVSGLGARGLKRGNGTDLSSGDLFVGLIVEAYDNGTEYRITSPSYFPGEAWSTGDAKLTFKTAADATWVLANDGSIGNGSSGATTRANVDTEALFTLLWNNIADAWCPVYDSSGSKVARGANAAADFAANRRLRLSRVLGRAIAVAGLGKWEEIFTADAGTDVLTVPSNFSLYTGAVVQASNSGGALPGGLAAATNYYVIRLGATTLKLATSLANAHAGTAIDITSAGTGTHTLTMSLTSRALGEHLGEESHSNKEDENGPHRHGATAYSSGGSGTANFVTSDASSHTSQTNYSGSGTPHNILGPETFMNVMIKL